MTCKAHRCRVGANRPQDLPNRPTMAFWVRCEIRGREGVSGESLPLVVKAESGLISSLGLR